MHTAIFIIFTMMVFNFIFNIVLTTAFWQSENLINIHGEETIRLFDEDEINDLENYEETIYNNK